MELVGVIAVMTQSRTGPVVQIALPGGASFSIGWLAVALGFVVWLFGQTLIFGSNRAKRRR